MKTIKHFFIGLAVMCGVLFVVAVIIILLGIVLKYFNLTFNIFDYSTYRGVLAGGALSFLGLIAAGALFWMFIMVGETINEK